MLLVRGLFVSALVAGTVYTLAVCLVWLVRRGVWAGWRLYCELLEDFEGRKE